MSCRIRQDLQVLRLQKSNLAAIDQRHRCFAFSFLVSCLFFLNTHTHTNMCFCKKAALIFCLMLLYTTHTLISCEFYQGGSQIQKGHGQIIGLRPWGCQDQTFGRGQGSAARFGIPKLRSSHIGLTQKSQGTHFLRDRPSQAVGLPNGLPGLPQQFST